MRRQRIRVNLQILIRSHNIFICVINLSINRYSLRINKVLNSILQTITLMSIMTLLTMILIESIGIKRLRKRFMRINWTNKKKLKNMSMNQLSHHLRRIVNRFEKEV